MSELAIIRAATMSEFGDYSDIQVRPDYEYDTCPDCGGRKWKAAARCKRCDGAHSRARWAELNVPEMLERHRRFEFALEVGYAVRDLMARARADALPTYEEMAAERPRAYMRVWCARNGIAVEEREAG